MLSLQELTHLLPKIALNSAQAKAGKIQTPSKSNNQILLYPEYYPALLTISLHHTSNPQTSFRSYFHKDRHCQISFLSSVHHQIYKLSNICTHCSLLLPFQRTITPPMLSILLLPAQGLNHWLTFFSPVFPCLDFSAHRPALPISHFL